MRTRRHRKTRRQSKKQRKIIIVSLICFMFLIVGGYSAFQTNLNITAKGNIKAKNLTTNDIKKLVVTTGDGLYKDEYKEGKYIYRGKNPNNWLKLNDELYRIISIESDGTVKVIKTNSVGGFSFDEKNARTTGYCSVSTQCNAWMTTDNYVNGNYNGLVDKDATLNTYLNNDFYNSLDNNLKDIIEYYNYNVGSIGNEMNFEELLVSEEKLKWKGYIGLISVSDYLNANNNLNSCNSIRNYNQNYETCNNFNWLYSIINNNNNKTAWTITPSSLTTSHLYVLNMYNTISNTTGSAHNSKYGFSDIDVLPSFYISSQILLDGTGTLENPYKLSV